MKHYPEALNKNTDNRNRLTHDPDIDVTGKNFKIMKYFTRDLTFYLFLYCIEVLGVKIAITEIKNTVNLSPH